MEDDQPSHVEPVETDEKQDPGFLGSLFQQLGYNWLGPGTDIGWNERNNAEPVNDLDAVAKVHDYAYRDIVDQFERGFISYEEASRLVDQADLEFSRDAAKTMTLQGLISAGALTMKSFLSGMTGPTFAGLKRERFNSRKPEYADEREDPEYVHKHEGQPGWFLDRSNYYGLAEWRYVPYPKPGNPIPYIWDPQKEVWYANYWPSAREVNHWDDAWVETTKDDPRAVYFKELKKIMRLRPGWKFDDVKGWYDSTYVPDELDGYGLQWDEVKGLYYSPGRGAYYETIEDFFANIPYSGRRRYVDYDTDRNYFPDRLEVELKRRRRKRRRHHGANRQYRFRPYHYAKSRSS